MTIRMIAACDLNRTIGKDNSLMWNLKSDMTYFKEMTINQIVVMGYNTYLSFGEPLRNRSNIVLCSQRKDLPEKVIQYHAMEDILNDFKYQNIWIIGGESVYKQFLPYADEIYLTVVVAALKDGDTFFPEISLEEWKCVNRYKKTADRDNEYDHWYCIYKRIGGK